MVFLQKLKMSNFGYFIRVGILKNTLKWIWDNLEIRYDQILFWLDIFALFLYLFFISKTELGGQIISQMAMWALGFVESGENEFPGIGAEVL